MRAEAERRSRGGELAIFAEATAIVDGVAANLHAADAQIFSAWTQESRELLFFIDALDELYLRRKSVADLFRRLEREIALETRPVRFVLSARNGSWTEAESRALKSLVGNADDVEVRLVTFESIDDVALRQLAEAEGVSNVDEFVTAIDADEIDDLIDLRPSDVTLLAEHWKTNGAFGSWSQILIEVARNSFVERRPEMAVSRVLSPADGYRGLLRMAAATTFMRGIHVTSPMTSATKGAVSARRLFDDWPLEKLRELFENPLLVHKGPNAEAVQLPQTLIAQYLAAQWLIERVRRGMSVTTLCDALMVRVFDDDKRLVPESLRTIVGWVASEVPGLRAELRADYPELLLYEGDPDRLADVEVIGALRSTCQRIVDRRTERGWPSRATLRKLARSSLEPEVARLLISHEGNDLVLETLLRFVEMGRYRSCSSIALKMALNVSRAARIRGLAVTAVNGAGDASDRAALMSLLDSSDEDVQVALVHALLPDLLVGDRLVQFLGRGGGIVFANAVQNRGNGISVTDLDAALQALWAPLSSDAVSDETERAFHVAVSLICLRVAREQPLPQQALDILAAIERLEAYSSFWISPADRHTVDVYLRAHAEARRNLWQRRFASSTRRARVRSVVEPIYGDVLEEDLPWLYEIAKTEPLSLDLLRRFVPETIQPPVPTEAKPIPDPPEEVRQHFEELARARASMEEAIRARAAEKKEAEEQERADLERDIATRRAGIESGEDGNALIWAWEHLRDGGGDDQLDPVRLRAKMSEEDVELFLRGIRASWRKHDVGLPTLDNRIMVMAMVGLTGLAMDVRAGVDLAALSDSDAARAAQYAMHALNKLPFWFADLFQAHRGPVSQVLRKEIEVEWAHPNEHHGVLRLASTSSAEVTLAIRAIVLDLLGRDTPAHSRTTQYAVDVLLASPSDAVSIATIARRELTANRGAPAVAQWLRLWSHVAPIEAAEWFAARGDATGREQFLETAARIEQDLDGSSPRAEGSRLMAPAALDAWIRLLYRFAPPEEDVEHSGFHRVEARDYVQRLRERCLTRLATGVTREAHQVLRGLIAEPNMQTRREILEHLADRQIATGAEAARASWTEEDVFRVEQQDEKIPRSLQELLNLVRSHLLEVARLIMNDDFSYRGIFSEDTAEREIQLWVASCLRERARGLYSVVRENVVDDDKEVDISAFAPGVGSIPIEIKPLGSYSATQLVKVLREQLLGRYMQPPDRRYGILLLVRRDKLAWEIDGRRSDLGGLLTYLRRKVEILHRDTDKAIHLESIDLLFSPRSKLLAPTVEVDAARGNGQQPRAAHGPAKDRRRGDPKHTGTRGARRKRS
jgi:hypothetical protein